MACLPSPLPSLSPSQWKYTDDDDNDDDDDDDGIVSVEVVCV